MQLTGAEIVIECLKEQGVDTVFGYPGGSILNVYDALYKHSDEITHILTSHEQGAAHAADGYARATGKVGVCFATSGPGATNLVTGIATAYMDSLTSHEQGAAHAADGYARATGKVGVCFATSGPGATNLVTGIATAYMDSIPMVAITCNVGVSLLGKDSFQEIDITGITLPITKHNYIVKDVNRLAEAITCNVGVSLLGKDSFQEIDITGITLPITKHNYIVKDVNRLADTIRNAFRIAKTGRPGPVLVDIPKDVTANLAEYVKAEPLEVKSVSNIREEDVETALEMIENAQKPYIFVGGGAVLSGASEELYQFAHKIDAPVADSLMGKGAFPGTDELYTGMLGMHGTKTSNFGVSQCDLLIVVGARFSDRVTGNAKKFASNAKVLQIDVDPAEVDKNIMTHASITGDIKEVLQILNEKLPSYSHPEWHKTISDYKEKYPLTYHHEKLTGPFVVEEIYRQTNGEAIITTEVGQHQMWAAQFYKYTKPRTFLTSGGLGTMGYGLGACIGAKIGMPEKTVVNIAGDGCFRMNMNEIATAARGIRTWCMYRCKDRYAGENGSEYCRRRLFPYEYE